MAETSTENTDYDKLVKDHMRMRLTESGWIDKVNGLVKEAITKRLENGQATNKIKFEQLYTDVIKQARDLVTVEMEDELHQKVSEYMSVDLDNTGETSSTHVSSTDVSLDISTDDTANNDDTWMEPKYSYQ